MKYNLCLLLISTCLYSQKIQSYKASNEIEYKKGDEITLNIGSAPDGGFQYFQVGGWAKGFVLAGDARQFSRFGTSNSNPTKNFAGKKIIIKKIEKTDDERVKFIVTAKMGSNYDLWIEEAIKTCEITDCKQSILNQGEDKYDKLKKIQDLKDSGTLSIEEFEAEKSKILKKYDTE